MAIWVTKMGCGVAGWFIYGWIGATIGFLLIGPVVCFAIGTFATSQSGGLLTPEQRRVMASDFARDNPEVVEAVCIGLTPADAQALLEMSVDRVAKKALMLSQGYEIQHSGMDRAGEALAGEENEQAIQDLYRALAEYLASRSRANWT
jgi:hypothetical protein